jgi:hypothetical protein
MKLSHRFWAIVVLGLIAPIARADDPPAVLIRLKSIEGLISDVKYIAKQAGQEEQVGQFEGMLKAFGGGNEGLGGIDTKRPLAIYGNVSPGVQDSPVLIMLPVADEKAFLGLLENFQIKPEKKDGVYALENLPLPLPIPIVIYFKFANKYVYITAQEKSHLDDSKLPKPDKLFAGMADSMAAVNLRVDRLPDVLKQIALGQLDNMIAEAKEKKEPNETANQTKLKKVVLDMIGERLKSVMTDGQELAVNLGLNTKTEDFNAEVKMMAKPGTALAKDFAGIGQAQSLFTGLAKGTPALAANATMALPEALRKQFVAVIDEMVKEAIKKETDDTKADLARKAYEALNPTLKSGELDAGVQILGPDAKGHYTILAGIRVKEGKGIEEFVKNLIKIAPGEIQEKVKLDAATIGEAKVHTIDAADQFDDNARKMFGNSPVRLVTRDDVIFVALGPDGMAAIKQALSAPTGSTPVMSVVASIGRLAALNRDDPNAAKVAKQVFGADPKGNDVVKLTVEGGECMRLKLSMKAKIFEFGAKTQQKDN